MSEIPYAAALTHVPETGETFYTPFNGDRYDDPITTAHTFMESERDRDDFPGSLWTVVGNEPARRIRQRTLLARYGLEPSSVIGGDDG